MLNLQPSSAASWFGKRRKMQQKQRRLGRRSAIKIAGAIVAAGAGTVAASGAPRPTNAAALRPNDPNYHFDQYEAIVDRPLTVRQVFEWPSIENTEIWANAVNLLNAFQFSYDVPPD